MFVECGGRFSAEWRSPAPLAPLSCLRPINRSRISATVCAAQRRGGSDVLQRFVDSLFRSLLHCPNSRRMTVRRGVIFGGAECVDGSELVKLAGRLGVWGDLAWLNVGTLPRR